MSRDVLKLRIDEKIRVLYAKSKNAVLIIEIVWNHKLDKPIRRVRTYFSYAVLLALLCHRVILKYV